VRTKHRPEPSSPNLAGFLLSQNGLAKAKPLNLQS
jgi:hypothetical protein